MQEQKNNEDTLTDDAIEAGIEELTLVLLYLKRFMTIRSPVPAGAALTGRRSTIF